MTEAGVFSAEMRLELMDGEIIEMAPIGSRHAAVVNGLVARLVRQAGDCAIVSAQNPVIVGEQSVLQPDIAILQPRRDRYFNAHPASREVLLVVEVAETSLRFDLERKVPLYARAGIGEAWVIDVDQRALHRFASPDAGGRYLVTSIIAGNQKIALSSLPDIVVTLGELFP